MVSQSVPQRVQSGKNPRALAFEHAGSNVLLPAELDPASVDEPPAVLPPELFEPAALELPPADPPEPFEPPLSSPEQPAATANAKRSDPTPLALHHQLRRAM